MVSNSTVVLFKVVLNRLSAAALSQHVYGHARTNTETQHYNEASQLTDRIDRQAAVVDTTNVIHALNTSAYHNSG